MKETKINPDEPEVTCEYGYYPYCPLCEHGLVIQEEWMQEDKGLTFSHSICEK